MFFHQRNSLFIYSDKFKSLPTSIIKVSILNVLNFRSNPSGKSVLKIRIKFAREHPCRSAISIRLLYNFIETALQHGCSLVNLLHIFRIPFPKNTSGCLLLSTLSKVKDLKLISDQFPILKK